jgi:hypothetical protein
MPIHNFDVNASKMPSTDSIGTAAGTTPGIQQTEDIRSLSLDEPCLDGNKYSYRLREDVPVAFHALERSLKHYFSDISVPANDYVRYLRIRISGGNKSVLMYAQEQNEGKSILPVASLSGGTSFQFNEDKFSPSYLPMTVRYLNNDRSLASKVFRPVPILVDYKLTVFTEHKRDMGYVKTQLLRRFHPYAEIWVNDDRLQGSVQLYSKGLVDVTELEVPFDQDQMQAAELSFQADTWIPLPELVVPTVRGTTAVFKENCIIFTAIQ